MTTKSENKKNIYILIKYINYKCIKSMYCSHFQGRWENFRKPNCNEFSVFIKLTEKNVVAIC